VLGVLSHGTMLEQQFYEMPASGQQRALETVAADSRFLPLTFSFV
jgi:hypothetical protein